MLSFFFQNALSNQSIFINPCNILQITVIILNMYFQEYIKSNQIQIDWQNIFQRIKARDGSRIGQWGHGQDFFVFAKKITRKSTHYPSVSHGSRSQIADQKFPSGILQGRFCHLVALCFLRDLKIKIFYRPIWCLFKLLALHC